MTTITRNEIASQLAQRLHQRAHKNVRTIKAEIAAILSNVLVSEDAEENVAKENVEVGLATAIRQRFAPLGDFEILQIPREPMRTAPSF